MESVAAVASVTMAEALTFGSATLVAVTAAEVAVFEGVNNPVLEIVPPVADHWTATFAVPPTVAVNWAVLVDAICASDGDTCTVTLGLVPGV